MDTRLTAGGGIALLLALGACRAADLPPPTRDRPHFLLIVADDLGYSDLGSYGGEIDTPNLDALAQTGLRATDFYVAPRGAPTRAMLMTGVDNHVAGFGRRALHLARDEEGQPGQEGRLSDRVATVASLLRASGYHTFMAGKWELGGDPESRPAARGFERSFALHDGAASPWADMKSAIPGRDRAHYTEDGRDVAELPPDFFSSRYYADFVIERIRENLDDGRPFFAYLAFQAPHGPFGLPEDWRDRAAGRYDDGYDAVRQARLLRMKRADLVRTEVEPYPGIPTIPSWDDLNEDQQRLASRKMELYAGVVENLDFHVGRVFDALREAGQYHETVIVFLSDNGAEPGNRGLTGMDRRNLEWYAEQFPLDDLSAWGAPGSFVEYGPAWAQVSMVPFRLFKGTQAEGGIRSPLIVSGPGVARTGGPGRRRGINDGLLHVTDLAPTFLELAGVEPASDFGGRAIPPMHGRSLVPLLEGSWRARKGPHEWLAFEFGGDGAVRREQWKAVWMSPPFGVGGWRLYRLDFDPAELYDVSAEEEEELEELAALFAEYARANGAPALPDEAQKSIPSAR